MLIARASMLSVFGEHAEFRATALQLFRDEEPTVQTQP